MKEYRATTTLNTKGGLIRKGEPVPKSYPRLEEAKRRGWIELVNDKLADVEIPDPIIQEPKPKAKAIVSEPEFEVEVADEEIKESTDKSELEPAIHNKTIESLEFLGFGRCEVLHAEGIYSLEDLRDKSITDLTSIKGVGFSTANKLKGAFDVYDEQISEVTNED